MFNLREIINNTGEYRKDIYVYEGLVLYLSSLISRP